MIHPETLRRIDLTGNLISEIEDGAFSKLPNLEELILAENRLTKLSMLPTKLVMLNVNFNKLRTQGVKANAFKVSSFHTQVSCHIFQCFYSAYRITPSCGLFFQKLTRLAYLYLGNNELTAVPLLPESLYVVHLHVSLLTFECNQHNYSVQSKHEKSFLTLSSRLVFSAEQQDIIDNRSDILQR